MQVAASRLLGQLTHERRGKSQIHDGIRTVEDAREKARLKIEAARQPHRRSSRPRKPG